MRLILKKEGQKQKEEDQGRLKLAIFGPYSSLFCLLNLAVKNPPPSLSLFTWDPPGLK